MCWEKDIQDGATTQEEKRKAKKEVYRYVERGHASVWCDKGRCI